MAKLPEIVTEINTSLKTFQFSDKRFQHAFNGIVEIVPKQDGETVEKFPSIITDEGDITKVTIDDTFGFQLYHRHVGSVFNETPTEEQFGSVTIREVTDNMIMIVMGDRDKIKLSKEDIITGIQLGFPLELGKAFLVTNTLDSAQIIQGEFNLDREVLWEQEFATKFSLKPSSIFLGYSYDVLTRVKEKCIRICE